MRNTNAPIQTDQQQRCAETARCGRRPPEGRRLLMPPAAGLAFAYVLVAIVLLGLLGLAGAIAWHLLGARQTLLQQQALNRDLLQQAVRTLSQAAGDPDGDGVPEAPAFQSGSLVPTGGGNLPTTTAAAKTDAYGHLLGYCSWDHGNLTSSGNRLPGVNSPLQSAVVFAVVSAGPDGVFQTSCANIQAGATNGDDEVRAVTLAELHQAVGGNVFMGGPVASQAALAALNNPATGEIHLAKDTNTLYQWNGSSWQSIGGSGGSAPTQPGKNLLINGNFDIWQRGATFNVNSAQYTADRWVSYTTSGTVTLTRQTINQAASPYPANTNYILQISAPSGVNYFELNQSIEHVLRFSNQTFTFSFWGRTTSGTFQILPCIYLFFGTGGTPSSSYNQCAASPVTLTTTWQRFSQTFTTPNLAGMTIGTNGDDSMQFALGTNTGTTATTVVQYAQIQAESGASATNYDLRPAARELYDCMRYYEVFTTAGSNTSPDYSAYSDGSGTAAIRNIYYRVKKRTNPNITLIGAYKGTNICGAGYGTTGGDTTLGFQLQFYPCSAGIFGVAQSWSADAD